MLNSVFHLSSGSVGKSGRFSPGGAVEHMHLVLLVVVCSCIQLTFEQEEVKLSCVAVLSIDPKYNVQQMNYAMKGKWVAAG